MRSRRRSRRAPPDPYFTPEGGIESSRSVHASHWYGSGPPPRQRVSRRAAIGGQPAARAGSGIGTPEPHHSDRETASNRAESRSTLSGNAPRPKLPECARGRTNNPAICLAEPRRSRRTNAISTKTFCISVFPRNLNRNDSRSERTRTGPFDFALQALESPGVPLVVSRVYVTLY